MKDNILHPLPGETYFKSMNGLHQQQSAQHPTSNFYALHDSCTRVFHALFTLSSQLTSTDSILLPSSPITRHAATAGHRAIHHATLRLAPALAEAGCACARRGAAQGHLGELRGLQPSKTQRAQELLTRAPSTGAWSSVVGSLGDSGGHFVGVASN